MKKQILIPLFFCLVMIIYLLPHVNAQSYSYIQLNGVCFPQSETVLLTNGQKHSVFANMSDTQATILIYNHTANSDLNLTNYIFAQNITLSSSGHRIISYTILPDSDKFHIWFYGWKLVHLSGSFGWYAKYCRFVWDNTTWSLATETVLVNTSPYSGTENVGVQAIAKAYFFKNSIPTTVIGAVITCSGYSQFPYLWILTDTSQISAYKTVNYNTLFYGQIVIDTSSADTDYYIFFTDLGYAVGSYNAISGTASVYANAATQLWLYGTKSTYTYEGIKLIVYDPYLYIGQADSNYAYGGFYSFELISGQTRLRKTVFRIYKSSGTVTQSTTDYLIIDGMLSASSSILYVGGSSGSQHVAYLQQGSYLRKLSFDFDFLNPVNTSSLSWATVSTYDQSAPFWVKRYVLVKLGSGFQRVISFYTQPYTPPTQITPPAPETETYSIGVTTTLNLAVPLLFLFVPALILGFTTKSMIGFIAGLSIGSVISVIAGIIPTWAIFLIGLAIVLLLVKGRGGGELSE
jgi:hypothetical protein